MTINFLVSNLATIRVPSDVVDDSINFVRANFTFYGDEWDSTTKTAIFTYNGQSYSVILDANNTCTVPTEVLRGSRFTAGIMGAKIVDGATTTIYTQPCEVWTKTSCYAASLINSNTTPSQYEQITALISEALAAIDALSDSTDYVTPQELTEALANIDLSALRTDIQTNAATISTLQVGYNELADASEVTFNSLFDLQSALADVQSNADTNTSNIDELQALIAAVQSALSEVQADNTNNLSGITNLQTRMTAVENAAIDSTTLIPRVAAIEATISGLADSFDALNGEVI